MRVEPRASGEAESKRLKTVVACTGSDLPPFTQNLREVDARRDRRDGISVAALQGSYELALAGNAERMACRRPTGSWGDSP